MAFFFSFPLYLQELFNSFSLRSFPVVFFDELNNLNLSRTLALLSSLFFCYITLPLFSFLLSLSLSLSLSVSIHLFLILSLSFPLAQQQSCQEETYISSLLVLFCICLASHHCHHRDCQCVSNAILLCCIVLCFCFFIHSFWTHFSLTQLLEHPIPNATVQPGVVVTVDDDVLCCTGSIRSWS